MPASDADLLKVFLDPIRKCADYRPAFGKSRSTGFMVKEFAALYGADVLRISWLGLDSPEMYAAHKAAGGITSVYRQVGVGKERLFRRIIASELGLSKDQLKWSYKYEKTRGKQGVHTLDAKIASKDLRDPAKQRLRAWLDSALSEVTGASEDAAVDGAVFEVRQGYKSADSKRQNADLRFGIHAYRAQLMPVFAIMSTQVSQPVIRRYRSDGMLVLTGIMSGDPTISTFAFFDDVIGFDLAAFFERNSDDIRDEVKGIVGNLLTPS